MWSAFSTGVLAAARYKAAKKRGAARLLRVHLLPVRYLEMGRLAARAVGRVHLPPADGRGMGFATGSIVAPGLMMTNHHFLPSAASARAATVTMDADDGIDGLPMTPRVFQLDPSRGFIADSELDFAIVGVSPRATDGTHGVPEVHQRVRHLAFDDATLRPRHRHAQ